MEKVCILGANRGILHGLAYKDLSANVVGICDKDVKRLDNAISVLGSDTTPYTDFEIMLELEKPDIVHIVTAPDIPRNTWFNALNEYPPEVVLLEKPIALTPDELSALISAVKNSNFHVVVNHQRRYFQAMQTLRFLIDNGVLGNLTHIITTSNGEPMEMGTHMMDLILMVIGFPEIISYINAQAYGGELLDNPLYQCPTNLYADMFTETGITIKYICDYKLPVSIQNTEMREERISHKYRQHYANRCEFIVIGTKGMFRWREYGDWFYITNNETHRGASDYIHDTKIAQRILSEDNIALASGIIEPIEHPCSFWNAVDGMDLIFRTYKSAFYNQPMKEPIPCNQGEYLGLKLRLLKKGKDGE